MEIHTSVGCKLSIGHYFAMSQILEPYLRTQENLPLIMVQFKNKKTFTCSTIRKLYNYLLKVLILLNFFDDIIFAIFLVILI